MTERNRTEPNETLAMRQAVMTLQRLDIPDPPSDLEFLGVRVHEVDGPRKERLLLAFGRIPLNRWLDVVGAYNASFGDPPPCGPENDATVVEALTRLHYYRVEYSSVGTGFRIDWGLSGIVPVTIWEVAPRGV